MNAPDLLAEFASRHGLPHLALGETGTACLVFDEHGELNFEHEPAAHLLHLYLSLGAPPAGHREDFFAQLLTANLFTRETGGATLGYDPAAGEVLLTRSLDLHLTDYRSFESAVERLLAAAKRVVPRDHSPAPTDAEPWPPDFSGMVRA